MKSKIKLGEEPISKLLLKMSLQTISAILLYSLYSIADTIFVARGVGTDAAGALAVSFPLLIFLSAVSTTIGGGAASLISRSLGSRDNENASFTAANSFVLFWIISVLIMIFGLIFLEPLLCMMGVTSGLMQYAKDYLGIVLLGAAFSTGFSSIIRAEGNTKYALYIWIIPTVINLILDPVFIFALHMGIKGAAIATVTAQFVSFAMSIYYFFISKKTALKFNLNYFKLRIGTIKEIIAIGFPSFFQQASVSITIVLTNNILGDIGGDITISSYGIVYRLFTFMIIPVMGLVQAAQPIMGYNYGAGQKQRANHTLKLSVISAALYGIIILIVLRIFPAALIKIFTADSRVHILGAEILKVIALSLPFTGVQYLIAAYFQSIGRKLKAVLMSVISNIIFIPLLFILKSVTGTEGVWWAYTAASIISCALSVVIVTKYIQGEKTLQD